MKKNLTLCTETSRLVALHKAKVFPLFLLLFLVGTAGFSQPTSSLPAFCTHFNGMLPAGWTLSVPSTVTRPNSYDCNNNATQVTGGGSTALKLYSLGSYIQVKYNAPATNLTFYFNSLGNTAAYSKTLDVQESADGNTWTNITQLNQSSPTAAGTNGPNTYSVLSTSRYVRLYISSYTSGNTSTNSSFDLDGIQVYNTTPYNGCYCYSTSTGTAKYISTVSSGTFTNTTTQSNYANYISNGVINTVASGSTFTVNVTETGGSATNDVIYIFADWNQDGVFSTGELAGQATPTSATTAVTVTVPPTAATGNTTLRIKAGDKNNVIKITNDPCQSFTNGEVEDYKIAVISAPATKLVFTQQPPATVTAGAVITPSVVVKAVDANGNVDASYTSPVTLNFTNATTVCNSLSGNTVTAVAGVATFSSLTVNVAESNISLTASSGSLTTATSNSFSATGGAATTEAVVSWDFEDQNTTRDAGNANNTTNTITSTASDTITGPRLYVSGSGGTATKAYTNNGWQEGNGAKYWLITVNTTGDKSLTLSSKQSSSNTGPKNFNIQYQVGTGGTWTDLYILPAITKAAPDFTEAVASSVALPTACENQSVVNIRWIMTSNSSVNGSTVVQGGTSRIDDIVITGQSITQATNLYYRSVQDGNLGSACTWQSSSDNATWAAATVPPDFTSNTITIRNADKVTINAAITLDQIVVTANATLILNNVVLTLNDGSGTDLTVNGTLIDNALSGNATVFNTGATWTLNSAGNYIKTGTSAASAFQDNYAGGISNILSTANWTIRYIGSQVSFNTTGAFYPNLTFESTSGAWIPGLTNRFIGSTGGYATVKGNLDIGGTGTAGTVTVYNENTNTTPMQIAGNLTVRSGSTLTNNGSSPGTGFELKGNLTVDGTLTANGTGSIGVFNFIGTTQQTVSGAGALNLYNIAISNAGGVLLGTGRNLTAAGALNLINGPFAINGNTLTLSGGLTHTGGSITGSATSNLMLNGSAAKALYFTNPGNVLHNVTISATGVTLDNALDITPGNTYGTVICDGALQTNGYLTLKSDRGGTAAVGQSSGTISGKVTVERYTDASLNAGSMRAWRLMTSPINDTTTIRGAWQEGGDNNTAYGTLITGENMASATAAAAQGYDFTGAGFHASIKHYVSSLDSWLPLSSDGTVTGTKIPVRTEQAYMLFVRGNRTVTTSGSSIATLRATGTLIQGTQPAVPLSGGKYTLLGNPYACSIDFKSVYNHNIAGVNPTIENKFYLWNSKLSTYGAYVLVKLNPDNSGNYQAVPSSLSGIGAQSFDAYRYIPSGSGFFVFPNAGATTGVIIQESDKAAGNDPPISPFRLVRTPANVRQLLVNLNLKDSDTSARLADGFAALFAPAYEGNEEDNSSGKIYNFNENLNLVYNGKAHIVEARGEVKKTDTLFMKMWYITKRAYQLEIKGDNFTSAPGIRAWLEDNYLKTKQELALGGSVMAVNFEVSNDSASSKSDRFRIVFENSTSVLPVTVTKVKAESSNGGVQVSWTVASETNIKSYTVEKSGDGGITFTGAGNEQAARNNPQAGVTSYSGFDATPQIGDNLYRIRIEATNGSVTYSEVAKVTINAKGSHVQITLYPNPVRQGKANLSLTNLKQGTYLVSVYTRSGQTVYQRNVYITLSGITQTEPLILAKTLAQGSYQIRLSDNKGKWITAKSFVIVK